MNERKTEDIVDNRLRAKGYYRPESGVIVEKQKSDSVRIQKLLEHASKQGDGAGKPEFIIRSDARQDFIVVIECKANPQKHVSQTLDRYSEFAVDGALLYAAFLSKEYDVLAIAVSGQDKKGLRIPEYYDVIRSKDKLFIDKSRTTWFVVKDRFAPDDMGKLRLESSGRLVTDVVAECRTAVLFVN